MGRDGGLDVLEEIGLSAFEFVIQAEGELLLPEYKGSTLRGAFGHAFKQVACPLKGQTCPTCLLGSKCAYFISRSGHRQGPQSDLLPAKSV